MQLTSRHRRWLERRGWRTTLDYRENVIRDSTGRLILVEPVWCAEGEQWLDAEIPQFVSTRAATVDAAWHGLRQLVQTALAARSAHAAGQPDDTAERRGRDDARPAVLVTAG